MAKRRMKVVAGTEHKSEKPAETPHLQAVPKAPEDKKTEEPVQEVPKAAEPVTEVVKIDPEPAIPNNMLSSIMAFKTIYALSTVEKSTGRLKATHYAVCLVNGREPMWGIFTVKGNLVRFASGKEQIAKFYPKLTWRKKMSEFRLQNVADLDVKKRRELLEKMAP